MTENKKNTNTKDIASSIYSKEQVNDDTLLDEHILDDTSYQSMFDKEQLTDMYNRKHTKSVQYKAYVKKEDEYKDIYSSGITFLFVSVIGIIILILNLLDILLIFQGALSFIVMSVLFLAFLILGISSLRKARMLKGQIGEEVKVTAMLSEWLRSNISKEDLDTHTMHITDENEKYLTMMEYMKECLTHHFGELDDNYLDYIVESFYDESF